MLIALAGGAVFLVPALIYLYVLFQRSPAEPAPYSGAPSRPTVAGTR
jgi:hypothetical protein